MIPGITLKNLKQESLIFKERAILAGLIVTATFLLLATRLYYLQIVNYYHYQTLSEDNRVRVLPVAPTRGLILDREGKILADNKPNYQLVVTRSEVQDMDVLLKNLTELIDVEEHELSRFEKAIQRKQSFQQVPLIFNMSDEQVARFAVNQHYFSGVQIIANSTRHYPQKDYFAHVLGYVARINEQEASVLDKQDYEGTTHVGKLGIEKHYEDLLHGRVGYQHVEVNAQGRSLRVLRTQTPVAGSDVQVSLLASLQKIAQQAMGDENGALVAVDPNNGDVLAFVSQPTYDPNAFVNGIGRRTYAALRDDKNRPMFNRALTGQYPPGSTVKPLIALAGLNYGVTWVEKTMHAGPHFQLPGNTRKYRDWKKEGHGWVNLTSAIAQSCDVYFYDLGHRLGIDHMHEFLSQFGLGKSTNLDTVGEVAGLLPSRRWKKSARGGIWYPGETVITSIGQGYMLATPLQLAVMTSYIAKQGKAFQPRFVRAKRIAREAEFEEFESVPLPEIRLDNPEHWQVVRQAMVDVVHAPNGTAHRIGLGAKYTIAGKTGTAQVFGIGQDAEYKEKNVPKHLRDHALFIAYAPAEHPLIVIAVLVENGGSGSATAAPIARKVLDAYLLGKNQIASR